MMVWRPTTPPPVRRRLSQEHIDALPRFIVLMSILIACSALLLLA